ncbi:MAG: response regulator [Thermoplasmata archaeon]
MHVLCVDDEPDFLDIEREMLERYADMTAEVATSVPEALEKLKARSYDAVVSDYHMAGLTGMDLLRFLRNTGNDVPFILLTGRGDDQVALEAMTEGATAYMEKGCDLRSTFVEIASMIRISVGGMLAKKALDVEPVCKRLCAIGSNAVMILNREGDILDCSASTKRIIGYSKEEVIGKTFHELIPENVFPDGMTLVDALLRNEVVQTMNFKVQRKDLQRIPAMICTAVLQGGERDGRKAICVIKDVSERKAMEGDLRASTRLCVELEGVIDEMCVKSGPGPRIRTLRKHSEYIARGGS